MFHVNSKVRLWMPWPPSRSLRGWPVSISRMAVLRRSRASVLSGGAGGALVVGESLLGAGSGSVVVVEPADLGGGVEHGAAVAALGQLPHAFFDVVDAGDLLGAGVELFFEAGGLFAGVVVDGFLLGAVVPVFFGVDAVLALEDVGAGDGKTALLSSPERSRPAAR